MNRTFITGRFTTVSAVKNQTQYTLTQNCNLELLFLIFSFLFLLFICTSRVDLEPLRNAGGEGEGGLLIL